MGNKDYTVRQILEMEACTNCRFCADVCPAVSASKEGSLSALYRMKGLKRILKSRGGIFRKLLGIRDLSGEEWKTYSDTVFRCTLCGTARKSARSVYTSKAVSLRQDLVQQ
jgi:heterodisulfide reductase subunit D